MCSAKGVFPVVPTIFEPNGEVDASGIHAVVDYIADAGAAGVIFPGLASKHAFLDSTEREMLIKAIGKP